MEKTLYDMLVEAISNGATDETLNTLFHSAKTEVQKKNEHETAVSEALAEATAAINDYLKVRGFDEALEDNDVQEMVESYVALEEDEHECGCGKETCSCGNATDSKSKWTARKMTDKEIEETIKGFIDTFAFGKFL